MSGRVHPRIGGVWHNQIAPWGEVEWSTDEHGCKEASWGAYFAPGTRHPALRPGALVELMDGPSSVWSGQLTAPDWREGRVTALGLSYAAEGFQALDSAGNATATPDVAVDEAIDRGWLLLGHEGIPTTPHTASADGVNMVAALLQSVSDELGQRWRIGADRILRMEADPTAPTWVVRPGVVELGDSTEESASALVVRYTTEAGGYATVIRTNPDAPEFGAKELPVDLTGLGPMSTARAEGYGDGLLAKGRGKIGWTNSVTVDPTQLLTVGGVSADLTMVQAGQLMRVYGTYDDLQYLNGRTHLDVVIGTAGPYLDGSDVIQLSPMRSLAETLQDAIEKAGKAA